MKMPLIQKEQISQKPFATPSQVVINHEAGLQSHPNKGHNRCGEITRISPYQSDRQSKQDHAQGQQGNGGDGFLAIGRGDEKKNRQLRPAAQQGRHLLAPG